MTWRMDNLRKQQNAPQRVELEIDELVLHGFAQGDRYRIAQALESELARLISEKGVPPSIRQNAVLHSLNGGAVNLQMGIRPDVVGIQVAREVYGRMRK